MWVFKKSKKRNKQKTTTAFPSKMMNAVLILIDKCYI